MGKLKVTSLFSGCGGMDLGILGGFEFLAKRYARNPAEIVYALDNDKNACKIFDNNFELKSVKKDIRDIEEPEIPPHHILTGGFPCQSFSIVAQNPPRLGWNDKNGRLVFEMIHVLSNKKPICFIAENVKGVLSANKGEFFPLILQSFKDAGYFVTYDILDASNYGIPQKRERVFMVGFNDEKILNNFRFPKPITPDNKVPLSSVILPEYDIEEKYYFSEKAVKGMKRVKEKMNKGRDQNIDEPCNTVGAHLAKVSLNSTDPVLKLNERYRRFTPGEVARIQSFPDNFVLDDIDTKSYRALGNAVPPVLMWYITREIIKAIKKTNKKLMDAQPFRTEKEIRSYNMSRIRAKDTKLETVLRKALWAKGLRYKKNCKDVYGKPDIAFKSRKIAVFCDSTFWHGRNFEKDTTRIKTNKKYWREKIKRNIERDEIVNQTLKNSGWTVLRFWDDEIKQNLEGVIGGIEKTVRTIPTP